MQIKREQTREQILEATRTALIEVGFERITTRRIAEAAGVNIAALHYYFGSKEALLAEAVRYGLAQAADRLQAAIDTAPSAAEALETAFAEVWQLVRERRGVLRYDIVVRGIRDPEARAEANAIYSVYHRLVKQILEKHIAGGGRLAPGLTVEDCAWYIVAAVDGIVLQHTVSDNDEAARISLSLIKQHALALIGAGKEENDEQS